MQKEIPEIVAAVDLGSNSFHMIVSRLQEGKLETVDRLKEMVRLASGLDKKNSLNEVTQLKALACLERFGQRLQDFPEGSVRAVGTNTLRMAKNSAEFLKKAETALGHPIHINSGIEEERLIYQGVAHSLESDAKLRLVMDIGGGSTEYIIGSGDQPQQKESLNMGCVTVSNAFFKDGVISKAAFNKAVLYAEQKLEPISLSYHNNCWNEAIGASGSLRSIQKVLQATGWSQNKITREGLDKLVEHITTQKHIDTLELPDLDPERIAIFPGGVAILYATFKSLDIQEMLVSDGALREGLIYDLLGRIYNYDIRSETVRTLAKHYRVDSLQVKHLKQTLLYMLKQLNHRLQEHKETAVQLLLWSAELHEIGRSIAHSQYHKHSAYIVENADLAGFSRQDQEIVSAIVRSHRRKFSSKPFKKLPSPWHKISLHLATLLRLAVLLHRNRQDVALPKFTIEIEKQHIQLNFPENWLIQAPLTQADLEQEADYLKKAGFNLQFS